MDGLAIFGALAASEGTNAMSILAPAELPPGHVSWTTKDIGSADRAFATIEQPSLLQTWMVTGACVLAWKEATFEGFKNKDEEPEPKNEEPA
ncbi:MAG: hypothetical protein QM703_11780 [Gemmatales bacterium]